MPGPARRIRRHLTEAGGGGFSRFPLLAGGKGESLPAAGRTPHKLQLAGKQGSGPTWNPQNIISKTEDLTLYSLIPAPCFIEDQHAWEVH